MNHEYHERPSLAAAVEPGDVTHYEFALVEMWDTYEIVVLNDDFFDKITFLKNGQYYHSYRNDMNARDENHGKTNPWTIRAATLFLLKYLNQQEVNHANRVHRTDQAEE
jgi:hypothetical protein